MKLFISIISCLLAVTSALASTTPEANRALLEKLQGSRTRTLWSCVKGNDSEAVVMFEVESSASGLISSQQALAIQDPQICAALNVVCPYVSGVGATSFFSAGDGKYRYWATRGKYEDTVAFFSESGGMKLVSVSNGSRPSLVMDSNWYFGFGECELQNQP